MNNVGQRSTAVMASGVVAILGSIVTAIGILIGMMGLVISFGRPNPMETMPGLRVITAAMMVIFFAVAIWGAFSGVGLIRFRNWARISVLVWAGIAAPICLLVVGFMAFIPIPTSPDSPISVTMIRVMMMVFYGGPLAIAVWWLILFTRPAIVAQFKSAAVGATGGSGDPFTAIPIPLQADGSVDISVAPTAYAIPAPLPGPSVPVPIIVLACFFLLSALSIFFIFFMHMPAMVFGHAFTGLTGSVVYAAWCVLYAIAGIGMLKRIRWAYSVAIGVQILGIVSGIITLLSPNFDDIMRHAMSSMNMPPANEYTMQSMTHLRGFSVIGLLFPVAILGMLVYYRPRFLQACVSKSEDSSSQGSPTTSAPPQSIEPVS
ncbi:MAG: hypothetical protein JO119_07545 [Acidobacteria bacterium]|nr:hypothetical protein [Acidobacteriota bacterium]